MIPIELKIKGLYSFKEEQTIDFTTLLESHLFGIFGKVGSGKSTILEAISFVLYGQSERLNTHDKRNYNMMNLMSKDMNIEFIFKSGQDGIFYKAIAYAKRNSKRHGEVKKVERKLYRKEEGEWLPIAVDEVPTIVGLSYDNFKRAIIIPQGKFQEFLGLKSTERSTMLRDIFNLDKFDLHHKAAILAARNKEKISNLTGQLEQLKDVTEERLKSEETTWKELGETHKKKETVLKKEKTKLKKSEKVKTLFAELHEAKLAYHSYVEKYEARVLALEAEAKKIAYCNSFFKGDLEQSTQQKNDINALQKECSEGEESLQSIGKQLVVASKRHKELEHENEKKTYYEQVIQAIDKGIKRLGYWDDKKPLDQEWIDRKKKLDELEQFVDQLEQDEKKHKATLEQLEKETPDLRELVKIQDWFEAQKDIQADIFDKQNEQKSITIKIKELATKKDMAIQPICFFLTGLQKLPTHKIQDALIKSIETNTKKVESQTTFERKLITQNALASHANSLKDGEACPVCGSLEHPNPLDVHDLDDQLAQVKQVLLNYKTEVTAAQSALVDFSGIASDESNLMSQNDQIGSKIKTLNSALSKHETTKFWKDDEMNSLGAIQKKIKQEKNLEDKKSTISQQIKQTEKELSETALKLKKELPAIDALEKKRDQLQSKMELLQDQILPKVFDKIQHYSLDKMDATKQTYFERIKKNALDFEALEQEVKALEEQKTKVDTTLKLKTKSLKKEQIVLDKIELKLQAQLEKSSFGQLTEVMALLSKDIDPVNQLERVAKYQKEAFSKKEKWEDLGKKTDNKQFDIEAFEQLQTSIASQEEALSQLVGQLAKTKSVIQDLTDRVKEKSKLTKELKALELRAQNIKTMTQLFKGQGFVNFISSVYLQNIVNAANDRFQNLTKHELSLELEPDNSFWVRDQLNGGLKRNIKTLSGGQTFQAALCLALALADNIHELTKSEKNFFFLDEGFGSQDNEAIAAVFKTLKALRKENRTVGIISHVDILQQEIDVHLTVELDKEKGSVIKQSW